MYNHCDTMSSVKYGSCPRHSSNHDALPTQGNTKSCVTSFQPFFRAWGRNVLIFTALILSVLASGVCSGALPSAANTNSATAGSVPGEQAPVRKEFPASRVREMLKELFQKRRAEMLERMFQTSTTSRSGVRGVRGMMTGGAGEGRRRERREVDPEEAEEKRLLSYEQEDRLGTFIGEVMTCQNIPGLSLGMTRGGARQGQGFGVADIETARPVDKDTLFGIGSNTKAFAAASLAHVMASAPPEKRTAEGRV